MMFSLEPNAINKIIEKNEYKFVNRFYYFVDGIAKSAVSSLLVSTKSSLQPGGYGSQLSPSLLVLTKSLLHLGLSNSPLSIDNRFAYSQGVMGDSCPPPPVVIIVTTNSRSTASSTFRFTAVNFVVN